MTDEQFLSAFENCTLPFGQWNHRAHVRVAYLYASRNALDAAIDKMRTGVQAYNAANNVPEAVDRGYHETITVAFMRLIAATSQQTGPHQSADEFCQRHQELLDKRALLRFYSRERIMTWEAKTKFVEPDLGPLPVVQQHLTLAELQAGLSDIRRSPADGGTVRAIVVRPETDERMSLAECVVSPELGVHGDNWAKGCWKSLPDGSPHPDVQVAIMNSRVIALIAQSDDRWPLAGDNLYVDLDLTDDNLPCGQQLAIGSAILEITKSAHNGCNKFAERFGADAVRFVNSDVGKALHLRGIYAKVVQAGNVSVGDVVKKS